MHDLLRTLSVEKKRKWPEHLPELVYIYNATPHSSTGFSPYFLVFGCEPHLPVDHLLGRRTDGEVGSLEEWLEKQQNRLTMARRIAQGNTERKARERREQHNKTNKANNRSIPVGTRVFLRSHPAGRNKIQDMWDPTPYKVIKRLQDNVYVIQVIDGAGPSKTVSRSEILDSRRLSESDSEDNEDAEDSSGKTGGEESEKSDLVSSESEPDSDGWFELQEVGGDNTDLEEGEGVEIADRTDKAGRRQDRLLESEVKLPRRSVRSTAGKHSNPNNLPKSVLDKEITVDRVESGRSDHRDKGQNVGTTPSRSSQRSNVLVARHSPNFEEFGQAVAMLGTSLSNSLGQTLERSWANFYGNQ